MAAIVTNNFRFNNAEQFVESFSEVSPTTHYLFLGRPQEFHTDTGGGDDQNPPFPLDNVDDAFMVWRDMIAAKKIASGDVSFAVPRHDWEQNIPYDYYRSDYGSTVNGSVVTTLNGEIDMFSVNSSMYVKTAANNVYKCLWNNGGANSVIEPTGTSTEELETADGYVWKYMYTLTASESGKFITSDFIPVHTDSAVKGAAVSGAISQFHIANGGSGYTNGVYSGQPIVGDGSGGLFTVTVASNAVSLVTSESTGADYSYADCNIDSVSNIGTPSISAVVTPIIPPIGGHGSNAIQELGGFYVISTTILSGTAGSGDFVVDQDFRRIGLIKDPYNYDGVSICSADTRNALKSITLDPGFSGTFINDEEIVGSTSGAKALVVDWDDVNRILKYIQTQWSGINANKNLIEFGAGENITTSSGGTGTVTTVNNPEVKYYSGEIFYMENRKPITRSPDQTENIKLIIEF